MFGEATSLQWWVGASTIIVGSFLISRAQRKAEEKGAAEPAVEVPADGAVKAAVGGCCYVGGPLLL